MKRFSETDKWRDPWFQALPHGSKLLFLYLCDTCNNAGFYEENVREACFHLGIDEQQYQGALKGLSRGIKGAEGWLWIRRFLRHQKNEVLNPDNPAHKQIIRLIGEQSGRFEEFPEFQQFIAPYKGLLSPIGIGKGKGTGKVKVQDSFGKSENLFLERVRGLFNKRSSTPLDAAERKAWKNAEESVKATSEKDWQLLEWLYKQRNGDAAKYRHQCMATLLNNWNGQIEKAKARKNPSIVTVHMEEDKPRRGDNAFANYG